MRRPANVQLSSAFTGNGTRFARLARFALRAFARWLAVRILIEVRDRTGGNNRRHRVLIDQLSRLTDRIEEDREGVEAAYHPTKLHASDEINSDADVFFTHLVEKDILEVQLRLIHL